MMKKKKKSSKCECVLLLLRCPKKYSFFPSSSSSGSLRDPERFRTVSVSRRYGRANFLPQTSQNGPFFRCTHTHNQRLRWWIISSSSSLEKLTAMIILDDCYLTEFRAFCGQIKMCFPFGRRSSSEIDREERRFLLTRIQRVFTPLIRYSRFARRVMVALFSDQSQLIIKPSSPPRCKRAKWKRMQTDLAHEVLRSFLSISSDAMSLSMYIVSIPYRAGRKKSWILLLHWNGADLSAPLCSVHVCNNNNGGYLRRNEIYPSRRPVTIKRVFMTATLRGPFSAPFFNLEIYKRSCSWIPRKEKGEMFSSLVGWGKKGPRGSFPPALGFTHCIVTV